MIACIACGGIGETMLIVTGLGWLIGWLKRLHNKRVCKCCNEKELKDVKHKTSL